MVNPTSLTSSNLQDNIFYDFNGSLFIQVWISPWDTHRFMVSSLMDSRFTSTPPCPTPALASNIYNLFISNPSFQVPFFSTTYHYHLRHVSPHMYATFLFHIWFSNAVTTFETNPYPQQYHLQVHSATSLRSGNIGILVRFLNTFFLKDF